MNNSWKKKMEERITEVENYCHSLKKKVQIWKDAIKRIDEQQEIAWDEERETEKIQIQQEIYTWQNELQRLIGDI